MTTLQVAACSGTPVADAISCSATLNPDGTYKLCANLVGPSTAPAAGTTIWIQWAAGDGSSGPWTPIFSPNAYPVSGPNNYCADVTLPAGLVTIRSFWQTSGGAFVVGNAPCQNQVTVASGAANLARTVAQELALTSSGCEADPGICLLGYDGPNSWMSNPDYPVRPYGPNQEPAKLHVANYGQLLTPGTRTMVVWSWTMPPRTELVTVPGVRTRLGHTEVFLLLNSTGGIFGPWTNLPVAQMQLQSITTLDCSTGTWFGPDGLGPAGTMDGALRDCANNAGCINDRATALAPRYEADGFVSFKDLGLTAGHFALEPNQYAPLGSIAEGDVVGVFLSTWGMLTDDGGSGAGVRIGSTIGVDMFNSGGARFLGDDGTTHEGRFVLLKHNLYTPVTSAVIMNAAGTAPMTPAQLAAHLATNPPPMTTP